MQINTDAKKIKRWREDRSWSQDHLAEAAGLSLRTIQRIENGEGASRESVMALAAAFNVDVISLTVDARTEAKMMAQKKRSKIKDALRMGFMINLACYALGLLVFTAISLGDGIPGYAMLVPALWWGVGVAGFGLAAIIVEVATYYQEKTDSAK